ncbi:MAG: hypothetical protein ACI9TH_002785, partial [Kiritimatiellia bacterium]
MNSPRFGSARQCTLRLGRRGSPQEDLPFVLLLQFILHELQASWSYMIINENSGQPPERDYGYKNTIIAVTTSEHHYPKVKMSIFRIESLIAAAVSVLLCLPAAAADETTPGSNVIVLLV